MTMSSDSIAIAKANGGLLDLQPGEMVTDGERCRARFVGYGDNAPIYVNLDYPDMPKTVRLPNAELRRAR